MIKEDTAMKDKWRILKSVLVITLMASVILACYIKLTAGSSNTEEPETDTSEVGRTCSLIIPPIRTMLYSITAG